jgi:hypothetical protein
MIDQRLAEQASELIKKGDAVLQTAKSSGGTNRRNRYGSPSITDSSHVDYGLWSEWRNQSLSFLVRTLGKESNYTTEFEKWCSSRTVAPTNAGIGILRAVKQDIEAGHLARLSELVRAELFSDFLEMAEYLLSEGYQDAAAVIGGGVLEEHIRLLCAKNNIPTSIASKAKKADTMNSELASAGVIDKNQKKIITGWLGIRNSAAHGKYGEYTKDQVVLYLAGIRDFIARFPA